MNEENLLKAVKEIRTFKNLNNGKKLSEAQEVLVRIIIRDAGRILDGAK